MRHVKSERLKKLETELNDLEQWLKLGLVPKKDIQKHKDEITAVLNKIEEEKERLHFLRESGEAEEYITPKRPSTRAGYTEMPSIPDIDMGDTATNVTETGSDIESESDLESSIIEERDDNEDEKSDGEEKTDEDEDSFFSDKNRWRRGGIIDPDANDW